MRFLLNGFGVALLLSVGGVVCFWIAQRWLIGSVPSAPALAWAEAPPRFEEVSFPSDGVVLAGELTLPAGEGPHPAMVVVHGSGRVTADRYRFVAEAFSEKGFAVLTYDKRGVGRSTGVYTSIGPGNSKSDLGKLASDALAGAAFLREHPSIDGGQVGLLGFSQAGWIIPLAASRSAETAFMVIVSGPTVTVGEEIYYSKLTGDDHGQPTDLSGEEISRRLRAFTGPHGFDPVPALEKVTIPGLWILGGRDRSIPIPETLAHLDELVDNAGKDFEVKLYPQGNHGLRDEDGRKLSYFPVVESWLRGVVR